MTDFDKTVLGKHTIVSTDSAITGRNNNVLIVGTSGSGKTYSLVEPTLQETSHSSLVISDPKGSLSKKYAGYFKKKKYNVAILNFLHPEQSTLSYDPLRNNEIQNSQDVMSFAHALVFSVENHTDLVEKDPFWDQMAEVLIASVIHLMLELKGTRETRKVSLSTLLNYLDSLNKPEINLDKVKSTPLGEAMRLAYYNNRNSEAYQMFQRVMSNPPKTLNCIISTVQAILARYNTKEMKLFMDLSELFTPEKLLNEKTVVFVQCSDIDDTLYGYINMFYTQTMRRLFQYSDEAADRKSLLPVRFILDDFATNVVIPQMPKWSSMMRERQISVMLMIQSITQLEEMYNSCKARTIISNCDYLVFLRTNDLQTAMEFSHRLDLPVSDVLYLPIGTEYIFMSGEKPIRDERYDMKVQSKDYRKIYGPKAGIKTVPTVTEVKQSEERPA